MKRHEACYWLNEMADGIRKSIEYCRKELEQPRKEGETEEQAASRERYRNERIKEYEQQLTALDIAGDALTK